ncbi:MAG: sensor histidine kinase [Lachnospiraceae bacterium]|nr:sensor histidine kinase [Lachnospiraceae bacterium]
MTSIVRKLHWSLIRKKISLKIGADIVLFLALFLGFLCQQEYIAFGGLNIFFYQRRIIMEGTIQELTYQVKDENGKILLNVPLHQVLVLIGIILLIVVSFQLIELILSYLGEDKKIRRILAPINEIALKADELSKLTFSEDKYQQIEEAISSLSPEESELLSFGDEDLQGIEAAMNNLLLRTRDSYRQQARFVNDASHELRTPIAVIQGYAGMLSRWGREDEKVLDESILAIQHETEHMKHLVEQLLFLARGDSGKTRLTLEQISLYELMQEVYEEALMIDETHPYRYFCDDKDLTLQADSMLLKQAVRILVDNAVKYTKEGDEIILSAGRTGDGRPYIQVQDSGIGMAEADVEHMFERFYRADEARSYQGTGLGLSIAKWIVDKHKGTFEILSRTELGTRIRIIF